MSAPVFLLDADQAASAAIGSEVTLTGDEGKHAVTVQRLKVNEVVELVDGHGRRLIGTVCATEGKATLRLSVTEINDELAPAPTITVVQAVAKGSRGELAVQMLTEVGVDAIVPWQAEHSIARWEDERANRHIDKWASTAREAAKQARRSRIPSIAPLASSAAVADLVANSAVALVLDEQATTPLTSIDISTAHDVLVVVGPEGGLSDNERGMFADAGADIVRLGPSVLRTSTAGVAALGAILSRTGRW